MLLCDEISCMQCKLMVMSIVATFGLCLSGGTDRKRWAKATPGLFTLSGLMSQQLRHDSWAGRTVWLLTGLFAVQFRQQTEFWYNI